MLHGVKNCVQHCSSIKLSAWQEIEEIRKFWGIDFKKKMLPARRVV